MASRWSVSYLPDQTGRVALVTGANAGLGLAITRALAAAGARVLMACRHQEKAAAAAAEVRTGLVRSAGQVEVVPLDLASLASVRALAEALLGGAGGVAEPRLDLLVNNAGLMGVDEGRTEDGFELQLGVNHLGHFALTAGLFPLLRATPGSRVVTMTSMGHRRGRMDFDDLQFERRGYQRWLAYFQSKLANLLFTAELDRRSSAAGLATQALAAHPGASATDLGTEGHGLLNRVLVVSRPLYPVVAQSPAAGAEPLLRAATDPDARGGELYGPRFLVRGDAVRETPSRRARDQADARRLWEVSEQLTGCAFDLAPAPSAPGPG